MRQRKIPSAVVDRSEMLRRVTANEPSFSRAAALFQAGASQQQVDNAGGHGAYERLLRVAGPLFPIRRPAA